MVGLHRVPPEGDVGLLGTIGGSRCRSLYGLYGTAVTVTASWKEDANGKLDGG